MLTLIVPGEEYFDEEKQEFATVGDFVLEMEHSLVSLSKWESKFEKPFLSSTDKTSEEILAYVEAMILTPVYPADLWNRLTKECLDQINAYIESKQSATTFGSVPERKGRGEIITSELIYYWLVAFNIPFECEHWNLNRLFTLIKICNVKNGKQKKMSRAEQTQLYRDENARRRAMLNTTG